MSFSRDQKCLSWLRRSPSLFKIIQTCTPRYWCTRWVAMKIVFNVCLYTKPINDMLQRPLRIYAVLNENEITGVRNHLICGSYYPWQHTAIFFSFFKPIELDGLKREITEAGIKCSMEKLMNYLDEKVFIQNEYWTKAC